MMSVITSENLLILDLTAEGMDGIGARKAAKLYADIIELANPEHSRIVRKLAEFSEELEEDRYDKDSSS